MHPFATRGPWIGPLLLGIAATLTTPAPVDAAASYELILDLANGGTAGVEGGGERFEFGPQGNPIMQTRLGCLLENAGNGPDCTPCNGTTNTLRHTGTGTASVIAGQNSFVIDVTNPCPQGDEFGMSFAQARFTIDDVIFEAPPGVTPPQVIQVSLNVESSIVDDVSSSGLAPVSVGIQIANGGSVSMSPPRGTTIQASPSFGVFTDRPNTLIFTLTGSIRATPTDPGANLEASAGFPAGGTASSTGVLQLAQATPVFNLPEGYTVNSPQAGIVNNVWNAPVATQTTTWGRLKALKE